MVRINGWHGFSTRANCVRSHSIDNASDLEDFIPKASQPNNSLASLLEKGNSNFDIRNRWGAVRREAFSFAAKVTF